MESYTIVVPPLRPVITFQVKTIIGVYLKLYTQCIYRFVPSFLHSCLLSAFAELWSLSFSPSSRDQNVARLVYSQDT